MKAEGGYPIMRSRGPVTIRNLSAFIPITPIHYCLKFPFRWGYGVR